MEAQISGKNSTNQKTLKLSSVSFLDLPIHIIEGILEFVFVGHDNNFEIATVCKLFYDVFCKLCRHKYTLKLEMGDMFLDVNGKLKSLLEHQETFRVRTFSKLDLHFSEDKYPISYRDVQELFKKFMQFLKHFGNSMTEIKMHKINDVQAVQRILSFTRRIQHLHMDGYITEIIDLQKLSKLKSLYLLLLQPNSLSKVLVRENSLEKIELEGTEYVNEFRQFISMQKSLKHLKLHLDAADDVRPDINCFENLKLERLDAGGDIFYLNLSLVKSLDSQTELQCLASSEDFNEEMLEVLGKMPKLREIRLQSWLSLNISNELSVTDLKIQSICMKSDEEFQCFRRTFPHVKKLITNFDDETDIGSLIKSLEKLEHLTISNDHHINRYVLNQLPAIHEKLHTLKIKFWVKTNFEFLNFLPNLVELDIIWKRHEDQDVTKALQKILEQPKLKILNLSFHRTFEGSFCVEFRNHEFISIESWNGNSCDDTVKFISENGSALYEIVRFQSFVPSYKTFTLIMAANEKHLASNKKVLSSFDDIVVKGEIHNGFASITPNVF